MKKRIVTIVLAAMLAVASLAGCSVPKEDAASNKSEADTESGKKVVRYAIQEEPPTLDPQLSNSMYVTTMTYHLFDGLYRNNNGKAEPAGAESYDLSDDGLTYTFHIRKGAKWSDGKEVTANDFAYGFQRLVDPATASPGAYMADCIKNGKKVNAGEVSMDEFGVKVVDDYTLDITLEYPCAYFPGMLSTAAFLPARKDIVEKYGQDFAATADQNVYNGPFVLADWAHGDKLVLKKNDNYWDKDAVKLDEVDVSVVAEQTTQVGMYESGDLDYVELPDEMVSGYSDAKSFYNGSVRYLQLNLKANEYFANADFRKAMNEALDRTEFNELVYAGLSEPQTRFVLPVVSGADGDYGDEFPLDALSAKSDTDTAKADLQKAMDTLGVTDPASITLKVSCVDDDTNRKAAEVIQEQLQKNLGIKVEVDQQPYKQLYENLDANNFEMMFTGWTPDYSDPVSYLELFQSQAGYNHCQYSSQAYDDALAAAQKALDPKERMGHLLDAETIFCEDLPCIPLIVQKKSYLISDKLTGFDPYFVGTNLNYIYADIKE